MFNQQAAEDFCRGYGQVMIDGGSSGIVDHYGYPYVSFSLGHISQFEDRAQADIQVQAHLDRFTRYGLGHDIRLKDFRVEPVSSSSALCHLRWELHPADGSAPWAWNNVYGLRQTPDGQYFEFNISDNEIAEILKRCPDFFS